ncbi:phospholipase-like protein [Tanacetum coccineum]
MLSLVIWHAFFGLSGSNNDINVLQQSPLFNDPKEGKAPKIPFVAHDVTYPWGYYLVDGMYPELMTLVKTISEPSDDEYNSKETEAEVCLKVSLFEMNLSGYEVPRVLVTCRRREIDDENDDDENVPLYYHINKDFSIPFGREEFCLVTGLRFGVQNWVEYDIKERIPFRRRVFSSYLDRKPITGIDIANMIIDQSFAQLYDDDVVSLCCLGILQLVILGVESRRDVPDWMLRLANDKVAWNKYPWGSYVWPTLYSQLRNANVKRWSPLYVSQPTNEDDVKTYSIFGYTWAFKGNMPVARLTPDDNEARSDWWISSKAYFDGFIGQVERVPFDLSRQNMYEIPSDIYREFDEQKIEIERNKKEVDNIKEEMRKFRQEMNVQPVRQENKEPIIVEQHYGLSDFSQFQSMQNIPNREKREQFPSKYKLTPFTEQPPTTILPKQRVNKTKNKGKKANLSPLNLGGAFEDDNVEENNVTFLGFQITGTERKLY